MKTKKHANRFLPISMNRLLIIPLSLVYNIIILGQPEEVTKSEITKTHEVLASSGDYYEGGAISLYWTLGECIVETFSGTPYTLAQGFHQPSYEATAVDIIYNERVIINVYPNPATEYLYLEILNMDKHKNVFITSMYDMQGHMVMIKRIENNKERIDVAALSKDMYILCISTDKGESIVQYKIEKIH